MRIGSGKFRGRTLLSPPRPAETRPITGRVKKSLMDSLDAWWPDATVLDLYCGTGTLGLEALSRGAAHCWFADRDREVIARLRRNINALDADEVCTVWTGDVTVRLPSWLTDVPGEIDVAFVDPPYAHARKWQWDDVTRSLLAPLSERLADDGLTILRVPTSVDVPEPLGTLTVRRQRDYGDMRVVILGCSET